jgi:type VI secretion system protein ImpF
MATRTRNEGPVTLSALDRLIDELPKESRELPLNRSQSIEAFKNGVRRDIEWLLNTRQGIESEYGKETDRSLYTYGLPDIAWLSMAGDPDRKLLLAAIRDAITKFEPRIGDVRVKLATGSDQQSVRFILEGTLKLDPSPEPVTFDTVLDLSSGEYKVPGESGAR